MQGFGPYAVTAGTIQAVNVDPSTVNVYIANDTPYDVFVSFNPTQPSPSSILNQDWIGVVQAFHHIVRPVPGGAQLVTPQGSMTFQGKVWLLPVNTRNTNLAQNGTVSSTANLYVEAYLTGEAPPTAYASPRQTDITSQARVITVPIVPFSAYIDTGTMNVGQQLNPFGGTVAASSAFGINIWCYIHAFHAQQYNSSIANARWELGFAEYDNSNNLLASHRAFNFVTTGADFKEYIFAPPVPWVTDINTPNPNTRVINLYIKLIQQSTGTQNNLLLIIQMAADVVNVNFAPPPIGGGTNQILQQSPGGIY